MMSSFKMAVFVSGHLGEPEDGVGALQAVVVRLFVRVRAAVHAAALRGRKLFKSSR